MVVVRVVAWFESCVDSSEMCLTSPESSKPPMVPWEVRAPSANLETRPHSSALKGPTPAPPGPFACVSSRDVGVELTVAGSCETNFK